MDLAIEVKDLTRRYGTTVAVDGISLEVEAGEVFGLLGPNGAGKTTTVECMLGLREPDGGSIRLLGMDQDGHSEAIRARVGAQLQTTGLMRRLTVREQIALFADLFPHSVPADSLLDRLDLRDKAGASTMSLSGGQRQRLALALALVNDPDLVFLDEPSTGLDPQARRGVWDLVRELKGSGKTVLLTTHYMEEAEQLCDRVAIVDHGKVMVQGTPAELVRQEFREVAIELAPTNGTSWEALAALPAVVRAHFENGHVTLHSSDLPTTMTGMMELARGGGLSFRDMAIRQASLEDLFLKLTGRRIRE